VSHVGRPRRRCSLLEIALMYSRSDTGSFRPDAPELDATAPFSVKQATVQRANAAYLTSHGLVALHERPPDDARVRGRIGAPTISVARWHRQPQCTVLIPRGHSIAEA